MRILLITPPMTQVNTPYPATAYLKGFLQSRGFKEVFQKDASLDLFLRLMSRRGLEAIEAELLKVIPEELNSKSVESKETVEVLNLKNGVAEPHSDEWGPSSETGSKKNSRRRKREEFVKKENSLKVFFLQNAKKYQETIDATIRFLQGRDATLAHRIVSRNFLPEGPRFKQLDQFEDLRFAFGQLGIQDQGKYLATLLIDDLADLIRENIDSDFELSRYGEKLCSSQADFSPIEDKVKNSSTLVDKFLGELVEEYQAEISPDVVGLSVPFPGNLLGALRIAKSFKNLNSKAQILMGGGYCNTELRSLNEPRLFEWLDAVILDDGELPFLRFLEGKREKFVRTFCLSNDSSKVEFLNDLTLHDIPQKDIGFPTYEGLRTADYVSLMELLNPMHRLWSDGRWNKLTLAHGCYWRKCKFCDTTLDYIQRYDPQPAKIVVDRMERLIEETGERGFHFVDEAAPPNMLRAVSEEILRRGLVVTWWGNIRFEKAFDFELTQLMARAGCIAVSGGLEVASDRLLKLMNKGVSVEQVAQVTRNFSSNGIMVHAYLMYGFPTQTEQETIDSLERVRQLFENDCVQSAFWHRFSATIHSPIGQAPEKFGIRLTAQAKGNFGKLDLSFVDPTPCDHEKLGQGLRKALYNFMHGVGLEQDVRFWFEHKVPRAKVPASLIAQALQS